MLAMRWLAQYRHQKARKAQSTGVANPEHQALARERAKPAKHLDNIFAGCVIAFLTVTLYLSRG
jgi:hypothetical protein